MKTLYIECNMGAAGDMLLGALLELHPDPKDLLDRLNAFPIPHLHVSAEDSVKCGVHGTHVHVHIHGEEEESHDVHQHDDDHHHHHEHEHHHEHCHEHGHEHGHEHEHHHGHEHHHHASMTDVRSIIAGLPVPESVRSNAVQVYERIAAAESQVHGTTVNQIHFHEVGTIDAIVDVVAVCLALHEIAPERIVVSPINTGCGEVRCAHGVLPVPAPATTLLLKEAPVYSDGIRGELCTPTGAALLTHFADEFASMPVMRLEKTGYGMGSKDFPHANCVRIHLGSAADQSPNGTAVLLECNLDDMTGEAIGDAIVRLLDAGAKDVWATPIQMKKNRPGQLLSCLTDELNADRIAALMLRYTTTIGVRRSTVSRYTLDRRIETRETPLGPVRYKVCDGYGAHHEKAEFDDLKAIADREHLSLDEVQRMIGR